MNGARERDGQHKAGSFLGAIGLVPFAKGVEQADVDEGAGQQKGRDAKEPEQQRSDKLAHHAADGLLGGD